jgi:hypothetical protein
MRLAWGGTVNMEYTLYDGVAKGLIAELGIDIPRLLKGYEFSWLRSGVISSPPRFSTRAATAATSCCAA